MIGWMVSLWSLMLLSLVLLQVAVVVKVCMCVILCVCLHLSPLLTPLISLTDSSSGEHWTDIDDDLFLDDINVGSMHDDDPDALLR